MPRNEGKAMHRITDCRASEDYRLWLRFDDGVEGGVFLGSLLEVSAFRSWRDVSMFCSAAVDPGGSTVVWHGGIRLDPEILYQDVLSSVRPEEFNA